MPFKTCPQCTEGVRQIDNKCWNCNYIFNPALEEAKRRELLKTYSTSPAWEKDTKDRAGDWAGNIGLMLGMGLPLLFMVGCTIVALTSDPEETRAQRICTSQGRSCDSDGYPTGLSDSTKRELQKMDRENSR
jgi:hypothetical protein